MDWPNILNAIRGAEQEKEVSTDCESICLNRQQEYQVKKREGAGGVGGIQTRTFQAARDDW